MIEAKGALRVEGPTLTTEEDGTRVFLTFVDTRRGAGVLTVGGVLQEDETPPDKITKYRVEMMEAAKDFADRLLGEWGPEAQSEILQALEPDERGWLVDAMEADPE